MALGTIHVLAMGGPVPRCDVSIAYTHKWAREILLTIPRARAFLIEDMRNGGDPSRPHGICEVKLSQRQDGLRGQAPQPGRNAADGSQGVAEALSWSDVLYHGQGQRQAGLLLGSRLSQGKVRTESGGVVNPDSGVAHSRLRDAEA